MLSCSWTRALTISMSNLNILQLLLISRFFMLCGGVGDVIHNDNSSFRMREVGSIITLGGAGFEAFRIDGETFLASANFWDGVSGDMSAYSSVHAVRQGVDDDLTFPLVQKMMTYGAHGADHFVVNFYADSQDTQLMDILVVPSYYGCNRGDSCPSTHVYYNWDKILRQFTSVLMLNTSGPSQSDHFSRHGDFFLVISENFVSALTVFQLAVNSENNDVSLTAVKTQGLHVPGIAACAIAEIDERLYLIGASYHNNGWQTFSLVYKWNDSDRSFYEVQRIRTTGAHDVETIEYMNQHFLIFSEDRSRDSVRISSNVLIIDVYDASVSPLSFAFNFRCTNGIRIPRHMTTCKQLPLTGHMLQSSS